MASNQNEKNPRWHLLYYLLAVFDILTVCFSLTLSHTLMEIYAASVASNQEWAARIGKIDELRERAVYVNAPGNDVFDSQDVKQENARLQTQLALYWRETEIIRTEIHDHVDASRAQALLDQLDLSTKEMHAMLAESELIFSYFTQHQPEKAGARMATMDRKFAQLNFALGKLSADIRQIQKINFNAQISKANNLKKYEYVIAALILLMVGAVTIYGHKISQEMRRYNVEREFHVAKLTEQDATLKQTLIKLQSVDKAKTEFLSNMSHELRTPMNGVLGMLTILLDEDLTKEQFHMAEVAKNSSESLMHLLNELLDFAKIEAGKMTLEKLPFNPAQVLERVVSTFSAKVREKNLVLILNIPPNTLPDHILGDGHRLQQILNNLVSNAIKFTAQGHILIETSVTQRTGEMFLQIAIEDTGIGIPEAKRSTIFNKFEQADASTTREYGGTGLGLAICTQLVTLMQGTISVHGGARGGSRFCLDLPLHDSDNTVTPIAHTMEGCRVLLVDDDPMITAMLAQTLQAMGCETSQQNLPQKVVNQLMGAINEDQPYHLVIIDEVMPCVPGLELLKSIKAESALAALRSIFLASECSSHDISVWQRGGIDGYTGKPIKPSALMLVVESVMQKTPSTAVSEKPDELFKTLFNGTILVVDDNHVNRVVALTLLEKFGLQVDLVESGTEALIKLAEHRYDLVFMDCQMPVLNGYETTHEIRQRQLSIPVVAMTANAFAGEEQKCLDAGMNAYLVKPIDVTAVEDVLRQWVPIALPSAAAAQHDSEAKNTQDFADYQNITQKLAEMEKMFGADKLHGLVLATILTNLPVQMDALRHNYESGNITDLGVTAHLLKGTLSAINAAETSQWCTRLEQAMRLQDCTLAFQEVENAVTDILTLIQDFNTT